MKCLPVTEGRAHRLFALADDVGRCDVAEFLKEQTGKLQKHADKMLRLLAFVADNGCSNLPGRCDKIEGSDGIYEFITGDLRIFWFYEENRVILCTHGAIKKGQKTKKADIQKAETRRKNYLSQKARIGRLV